MSQITWQDFLNILTLKSKDIGVLFMLKKCSEEIKKFDICLEKNKDYLEEWLTENIATQTKSTDKSTNHRLAGNKVYQQGKDSEALNCYNLSIIAAPFDSKQYALALSNRSAVLFRLGFFKEAIQDITLALENCNSELPREKLLIRKALALHKLKMYMDVVQTINSVYSSEAAIRAQTNNDLKTAYFDALENGSNYKQNDTTSDVFIPLPKGGENQSFSSASECVILKYSKEKGRHVIATDDFAVSDIVFVEKPFAFVVLPEYFMNYCHHCCKKIISFIPCENCTRVVFCGKECKNEASERYHQWECLGINICHTIGIAHLGLRVALLADSSLRYQQVGDLNTHISDMKPEDLCQYAITAALLMLYLEKYTNFFECNPTLKVEEMGYRILRHIAQLICNGHAITEVDSDVLEKWSNKTTSEEQKRIATAIYPSASMMNHSCDQNISNSFINEYLIVRATRPIKRGEEVFNCYGPHYKSMSRDERQRVLASQYFFTCDCKWCSKGSDCELSQFSALLCSYCSGPVMEGNVNCSDCQRPQPLIELVNMALTAQRAFHQGKLLIKEGKSEMGLACVEESIKLSTKCLYKHNSDLRTYKDYLARLYAEHGKFHESIQLVETCITSIEKQFGSHSIEVCRELIKLVDLFDLDMKYLIDSGQQESKQYRNKQEKMKKIMNQLKQLVESNGNIALINDVSGLSDALSRCQHSL